MGMSVMSVEIIYNDMDDKEHYPFGEKLYDVLEDVAHMIFHPDPENSKWYYFATSHGAILHMLWEDAGISHRNGNLGIGTLKQLVDLEGLRWIESSETRFVLGLEFSVVT